MMMALEKNEDLLRADPHSGLDQLADQTGGFLIANTNDLRGGFQPHRHATCGTTTS